MQGGAVGVQGCEWTVHYYYGAWHHKWQDAHAGFSVELHIAPVIRW